MTPFLEFNQFQKFMSYKLRKALIAFILVLNSCSDPEIKTLPAKSGCVHLTEEDRKDSDSDETPNECDE